MKEDKFRIRITSKGEVFGASMFLPVLQQLVLFKKEYPKGTLDEFTTQIIKVLERQVRRGKANEDGTLQMKDFEEIKEIEPLFTNLKKQYEQIQ